MVPWAGHLVFIKWNKILALFSPRRSKDKAYGRSWALLKQRDKVPTPKAKENFPVYTCTARLLGRQNGRGHHPVISADMHPRASMVGSSLAKCCTDLLARVLDKSDARKKQDNRPKYKQRTRSVLYKWFTSPPEFRAQEACPPLRVCISAQPLIYCPPLHYRRHPYPSSLTGVFLPCFCLKEPVSLCGLPLVLCL